MQLNMMSFYPTGIEQSYNFLIPTLLHPHPRCPTIAILGRHIHIIMIEQEHHHMADRAAPPTSTVSHRPNLQVLHLAAFPLAESLESGILWHLSDLK